MSITGTGYIIILLGFYGLLFNTKFLYNSVVFFVPFSATAVINIGYGESGSAIQPFMFLGALWLISICLNFNYNSLKFITVPKSEFKSILFLICFTLSTLLSLFMPFLIDGKELGNVTGVLNESSPIKFSLRNISQFIYLLFGVIMSIAFYLHNKLEINYKKTIKTYCYSILFVIFWGCIELICYYKNFPYPSFIFNNSISKSAQPFDSFLQSEDSTKRLLSVAVEPSILVQSILFILPFLIINAIEGVKIFNKVFDFILIVLMALFTLRSTSTIGIICLGIIILWSLLFYFTKLNFKSKILYLLSMIFLAPILIVILYSFFQSFFENTLLNKGETYSALERSSAIIEAWGTFLNHPMFGTGWGSVTSFDLFIKILSNTGILGLISFLFFLFSIVRNQINANDRTLNKSFFKTAIIISFVTLIFSNIISGFSFVFGFFWLATGLMLVTRFHSINIA